MAQLLGFLPNPLRRVLLALLIVYLVVCILAWVFQRRLIYFPNTADPLLGAGARAAGLVDVDLTAADGIALRAWYWPAESPRGTVVMYHGNAGNRADRRFWMARVRKLGWSVFVVDYRGYGGSAGEPTEEGLYADGLAAFAWAEENAPRPLVIAGSSLGTGVAVEVARQRVEAGVILTAAPTSMAQVGQDAYPFLPAKLLLRDRYDNLSKIRAIDAPLLMLHGEQDEIIAIRRGRELYAHAQEPKRFVALPAVGHNDVWDAADDAYWKAIEAFLGTLPR